MPQREAEEAKAKLARGPRAPVLELPAVRGAVVHHALAPGVPGHHEEVRLVRVRGPARPGAEPVRDQRLHAPLPVVAVEHPSRVPRKALTNPRGILGEQTASEQ